jgi:tetratricopeptide (TPR) repeat protein
MKPSAKRPMVLAVVGLITVGGAFWLREAGVLQSRQARANEEFILSERAHHAGQHESAIRHLQNAVKMDPQFVEAREGLAAMYEQFRGLDAAVAEYQRAIQEDPKNEARYCYRVAQIYFVRREWDAALQWLRRAEKLQPDDFHVQRMIGFCLERQGKWREAERHWSALLQKKNSNDADVQRALQRVRRHLHGQPESKGGKGG